MEKTKNTVIGMAIILISLLAYNFFVFDSQLSRYDTDVKFSIFDQVKSVFTETNLPIGTVFYEKNDDDKEDYVLLEKGDIGITVYSHQTDYVRFNGFLYPTNIDHRNYGGGALCIFIFLTGILIFACVIGISYIKNEQDFLVKWMNKG